MTQLLYSLPVLACPLGMGLMTWLMMRGGKKDPSAADAEVAVLRVEVDRLRAIQEAQSRTPAQP